MISGKMTRIEGQGEQLTGEDGMVTKSKTIRESTTRRKARRSSIASYVCEELIGEIFERLPVKSLIRFRTLSKSWCTRIASPDFIRRYTLRSMTNPQKLLIQHVTYDVNKDGLLEDIYTLHSEDRLPVSPRCGYIDVTPVKFPFPSTNLEIVGSCNGIICLIERDTLILWNFSIRRKVVLHHHPFLGAAEKGKEKINVSFGFGFDSVTYDYKIVGILHNVIPNSIFVYSMKTNSWSEIDLPIIAYFDESQAYLFNGALHWVVVCSKIESLLTTCYRLIVTFDLNTHVFDTISLPEPNLQTIQQLATINGFLASTSTYIFTTSIWVRRDCDNVASWSMVYKLDMQRFNCDIVLKSITNGGFLLFDHRYRSDDWYKVYNPKIGVASGLLKFKDTTQMVRMETYVESIELLDKGTACGETVSWKKSKGGKKKTSKTKDIDLNCYL